MSNVSSSNSQGVCVPKLRFPGFEGEWEHYRLGDIVTVGNGMDYKKLEKGDIPVYGTGGYMLSVDKALSYDKDAIGIGRKGTIDKPYILKAPFWTVDTLFYCIPKDDFNLDFLYGIFQKINWKRKDESTGVPSLSKTNINLTVIAVPSIKEQKQIADLLTLIDNKIEKQRQLVELLKSYKRGALSKLFPQKGETKPRYRFAGFTKPWEHRKFSELYEKVSRKNDMSYGKEDIISVANMYYKTDSNITDDSYLRTYNVFELGDIAFEGNKSKNFAHGRFVENTIGNGIVSHVFDVFKPLMPSYDLMFWKYAINNERLMGDILVRSTKASTMMTNLVANDFLQESFFVPSYEEQKKIGTFFCNLDHLIALHQRRLNEFDSVKTGLLQQLFI